MSKPYLDVMPHLQDCDGNGSVACWTCGGEGSWHDCGEDCCCCLIPRDNVKCSTCQGRGVVLCPGCASEAGGGSEP